MTTIMVLLFPLTQPFQATTTASPRHMMHPLLLAGPQLPKPPSPALAAVTTTTTTI